MKQQLFGKSKQNKFQFLTSQIFLFVYIFLDNSMQTVGFQAYCMSLVGRPPDRTAGCIFLLPLVLEEHKKKLTLLSISSSSTSISSCFSSSSHVR
jgi:hypothetical protein